MFIPACHRTNDLMGHHPREALRPIAIAVITTVLVMVVSGRVTRSSSCAARKEYEHGIFEHSVFFEAFRSACCLPGSA